MHPPSHPARAPLCAYYSSEPSQLLDEIQAAYRALPPSSELGPAPAGHDPLRALIVPHGAACDGFYVAAHAYRELNAYLRRARCRHLTAVLIGTEHMGTAAIALSRLDWRTPVGTAAADTAAVEYLASRHLPVNESPHATEHSIENQLPFLLHGAACGWDLRAAGCLPHAAASAGVPEPLGSSSSSAQPAGLSIVPISVGYLGHQPALARQYGAAVADLLAHLHQRQRAPQHGQTGPAGGGSSSIDGTGSSSGSGGGHEVVLIVSSDFTHAGPGYGELPPAGLPLEGYMAAQDAPLLRAIQQGSAQALLAAAAATRNSLCGLWPLVVALEALYGDSSVAGSGGAAAGRPVLLEYKPAHLILSRPDSTGFAAFAVWSAPQQQHDHRSSVRGG